MALNDVIKKKQETSKGEKKAIKFNPTEDVRVFIAFMVIACIGIIIAIFFCVKSNNKTIENIDSLMVEYNENQAAIANLHALQSKSSEYTEQRDKYNKLISEKGLDQPQIMIDMDTAVASYNCILTDITFGETTSTNGVNQISVTLKMNGTYDDIMKFAYDTVNGEQIKRIDTIKISPAAEGKDLKSAEIVVVLFSK